MKHLISAATCTLLVCANSSYAEDAFTPACALPYAGIALKRPIDRNCPPEGSPSSPPHAAEYRAKNNLCAAGPAIDVTLADMFAMQKAAEDAGVQMGRRDTPVPDREQLKGIFRTVRGKKIGEGDMVRLVVYVTDAKPTGQKRHDGTGGEGVNCKNPGPTLNDIHLDIGSSPTSRACDGVVAEMIPHFRPTQWTPTNLGKLGSRPVRMTGHLFLDSRHNVSTCSHPSPGDPPRISLWEIHPVYALDVCKSTNLSRCDAHTDASWIPFDQWLASKSGKAAKPLTTRATRQQLDLE